VNINISWHQYIAFSIQFERRAVKNILLSFYT